MLQTPHAQTSLGGGHGGRLRILHVAPTYYPAVRYGGPIRSVHALAAALAARGHDVHVFTSNMDGPGNLQVPMSKPVLIDGVKVHYFAVNSLRRLCWCPSMAAALRHQVADFDLVHLHSVFLWPTWAAARHARRAGVAYVVSPRGMLGRTVINGKSRWIKSAWINLIEKRTLRDSACIHVTAELERDDLLELGLPLPDISCVPNGVSWPARHTPLAETPYASVRKPYALFLSRIDWKKGLDRLIKAWQWVPHLTLIIAGNDESGYQQKLESLAADCKVSERIHFIGQVSDDHKWALYEEASMFLLPSYSENFGNVVAEAMAMGCPVVVTPEVGLARVVRDSGAGVVCDGDPAQLAGTIRTLYQDASGRRLMGERGRFTARRKLSWESAASSMESLYRSALGLRISGRRSAA